MYTYIAFLQCFISTHICIGNKKGKSDCEVTESCINCTYSGSETDLRHHPSLPEIPEPWITGQGGPEKQQSKTMGGGGESISLAH